MPISEVGPKRFFYRSQNPVYQVSVAFELKYGVDHVLQYLGSGKHSVFGDVPDQYDRRVGFLGELEELARTLPHLCNTSGCGIQEVGIQRLDGVNDDEVGL